MCYLNKGMMITFRDERHDASGEDLLLEGGVMSFVRHLNKNRKTVHPQPIYIERKVGTSYAEIALQYNDSSPSRSSRSQQHPYDRWRRAPYGFRGALRGR